MSIDALVPDANGGAAASPRRRVARLDVRDGWLLAALTLAGGVLFAYLATRGLWFVAVGLLAAVPAAVLLLRHPWVVVPIWICTVPVVSTTHGGAVRAAYWLVHRGLPPAAVVIVVFGSVLGLQRRQLPRLGLPEVLMAGYLVATTVSILYTAPSVIGHLLVLYDRVAIPMCLYLLVRLLQPGEREIKLLVPVVIVVLVVQAVVGMISWIGPAVLRPEWLGKVGERTTGTLQSVDVFGTTMLFCALFLLHVGLSTARSRTTRIATLFLFLLSMLMVFMSFSRATWLAGALALLGLSILFRQYFRRIVIGSAVLLVFLAATGLLNTQWQYAQYRFDSQQSEASALSRLPVFLAAVRMFEAKPVTGFGYENFDRVDRPFQGRVGDLVYPEKNHASHNLFLTLLAEQGIIGISLYLGPAVVWLVRSVRRGSRLPAEGVLSRRFVAMLWLVLLGHVVVNNFSRMHLPFGLGMWWFTLGLIGSIVARATPAPSTTAPARERVTA